jgi:hypothetical protein
MIFITLISLFFQTSNITELPEWFYEPPANTLTITCNDSYTRLGRARSIEVEANVWLTYQKCNIRIRGNDARKYENYTVQIDRYKVDFEILNKPKDINYVTESGFVLLDLLRIEGKVIVAILGPKGTVVNTKRVKKLTKPNWVLNSQENLSSSIGKGNNNVYFYSNWLQAQKHAFYNIAKAASGNLKADVVNQRSTNGKYSEKYSSKVSILDVDATYTNLRVTSRWIDPEDGTCWVKVEGQQVK